MVGPMVSAPSQSQVNYLGIRMVPVRREEGGESQGPQEQWGQGGGHRFGTPPFRSSSPLMQPVSSLRPAWPGWLST